MMSTAIGTSKFNECQGYRAVDRRRSIHVATTRVQRVTWLAKGQHEWGLYFALERDVGSYTQERETWKS